MSPLRVDLDNSNRSGVLNVNNEAKSPLRVSIKLMKWTQSPTGEDSYSDSDALVFFPRSLIIEPGDSRVVRVGLRAPLTGSRPEQAFRLYIEQAPSDDEPANQTQVKFRFRFGIPIFVAPAERKVSIDISELAVVGGKITVAINNSGTETVRFDTYQVTGDGGLSLSAAAGYHHPGTVRRYQIPLPADRCVIGRKIEFALVGEKANLKRDLRLEGSACDTQPVAAVSSETTQAPKRP